MTDETRKAEICYSENFQQFRALNAQMNQVPVLTMTLTGGLWFGAGIKDSLDVEIRFALLMLAGFSNIALTLVVLRIRDVLQSYLDKIEAFHPESFAGGTPKRPKVRRLGSYSMVTIIITLMLMTSAFSFLGAFYKYWPLPYSRLWGVGTLIGLLLVLYFSLFKSQAAASLVTADSDA